MTSQRPDLKQTIPALPAIPLMPAVLLLLAASIGCEGKPSPGNVAGTWLSDHTATVAYYNKDTAIKKMHGESERMKKSVESNMEKLKEEQLKIIITANKLEILEKREDKWRPETALPFEHGVSGNGDYAFVCKQKRDSDALLLRYKFLSPDQMVLFAEDNMPIVINRSEKTPQAITAPESLVTKAKKFEATIFNTGWTKEKASFLLTHENGQTHWIRTPEGKKFQAYPVYTFSTATGDYFGVTEATPVILKDSTMIFSRGKPFDKLPEAEYKSLLAKYKESQK